MLIPVIDSIQKITAYKQLTEDILAGVYLDGLGLPRSARLPFISAIHETLNWPMVLVVERMDQALRFIDEISFWMNSESVQLFPEPTPMFYERASWGSLARRDRLKALIRLSNYHLPGNNKALVAPLIITTVRGLMTKTLPRRDFLKSIRNLNLGQEIQPDFLAREWVGWGYDSVEIVVEPGQFSRRGGLLDIWSVSENYPVRLDFFGDEIDTIRQFDPATQRTIQKLEKINITPASEVLPYKAEAAGIETVDLNEFSLPLIYPQPASLLDYLPRKALILLEDSNLLASVANEIEEQAVKFRLESIREGTLDIDFPIPYQSWSEITDILGGHQVLELGYSQLDEPTELAKSFSPGERFGGKLKPFIKYLLEICNQGDQVWIVSRQIKRIKELWNEQECDGSAPTFIDGSLSDGWVLNDDNSSSKTYLITDSEIFGWDRPAPRKRIRPVINAPETAYSDLKPGDWVVHIDYGIGKFVGLVQRVLDGVEREFLCVEYGHQDQLFVPVHQADRLGRYVGTDGSDPKPTRLGSPDWTQAKTKVREAVLEIAKELLELYALRSVAKGNQFSPDVSWQKELEASFPYVETEDQIRAINEVKHDMEAPRPMDRLLCGDVGYGKTEVALRAAFKAVMDGKQVAILVPTTVLAQQHFETFRERLSPYPVKVEMLSRFRTSKEQDDILIKLLLGEVDIIIGTHRLIQKDVYFKDLGLVIIDEEQRFGVTHKEFFKKIRTELDVLTLTATPIPRTLYMALTGVRDISMINTPPAERQPVVTHIGPYSKRLVRQAIIREIDRGGQIFFVHNRVHTINAMKMHLQNLVPEARIGVGHGQMHESELSQVMQDFTNHDIDLLLSTSIIESGLDIPNANTLIVDRGDAFGLAQLYQLRGRVGRGAVRAYAYFFRHRKKPPTIEGQERLETIAEYSQLGSGYSIAMRDLEMRGAGELLGTRQHGAITSVGFHLYTRLLAQAVRSLKNQDKYQDQSDKLASLKEFSDISLPVTVDLPINISIPIDYVSDKRMRLSLYRRIAAIEKLEQLDELIVEFEDRFGKVPDELENLFFQIKVKQKAERAGISSVAMEGEQLVLRYPPPLEGTIKPDLPNSSRWVRTGKNSYWLAIKHYPGDWKELLIQTLDEIIKN